MGFGLASGIYLMAAALGYLIRRRVVWILVAVFDMLVIITHFAVAGIRQPPPRGVAVRAPGRARTWPVGRASRGE